MIEHDIEALIARDGRASLDHLEADIWRREALHQREAVLRRLLASSQAIVIVFIAFLSAGTGTLLADERSHANLLSPGERYAPSMLLFGDR